MVRIAAAAYKPDWWTTIDQRDARLETWVAKAADQGAELIVFPEYAGCEAALNRSADPVLPNANWAPRMATREAEWRALHSRLAQAYGLWIIAGSLCAKTPQGYVNRSFVLGPGGESGYQDKIIPTPYERDTLGVIGGDGLNLFDTPIGKMGILICYDSEFPLLARALVEAGVDMIIVPSATDFAAGHTRVRQSCRARAIEGQCLVVQAPLLGGVAGCDVLDTGTGAVGAFGPPDYGLPDDGIIAQGDTDRPGWTVVDVDLPAIAAPRQTGQVGNVAHWPEQSRAINSVTHRRLR